MRLIEDVPSNNTLGLEIDSPDEERDKTRIHVIGWKRWKVYEMDWIPFKPIKHKVNTKDYKYIDIIPRRFGFKVCWKPEYHIYITYGVDHGMMNTEKYWGGFKFIDFGWMHKRHYQHQYLKLNGDLVHIAQRDDPFWEGGCPGIDKMQFKFFDGVDEEEIIATVSRERRILKRGSGWFKWLSIFYKDEVIDYLEMNFDKEVGSKKGSWKGGIVGTSTRFTQDESPEIAFQRYCIEENHFYGGVTRKPVREYSR
ncbi:MAG: hypothetical protein DRJ64_02885 [Thermoprotei archaeon]|nr:MAG: hypothetical protein DRJ64_02885 [Thermoprotei archaeon]